MRTDSSLIDGTITGEKGEYTINKPAIPYIIQASCIGYKTAFGGPDFIMPEETEQLTERKSRSNASSSSASWTNW
ncbi:MAG: carboxypeptidase-like regulatory domain-containing protein [Paludibacteraceae bacterium]|nr:carboxypeptidase-like regulatory domain-containing protein [Paludibacteraceae bacterium]